MLNHKEGDRIYEAVIHNEGFHTNGKYIIGVYHTDDGCYKDTDGDVYGVDGGNIGIVPIELCNPKSGPIENRDMIIIKNEFKFGFSDNTIYLEDPVNSENSFEIIMGNDDTDDDE